MENQRNTKIIATIGPKTSSSEALMALFQAGANTFRLNMSHLTHEDVTLLCGRIREIEDKHQVAIGILVDLQGPKIRLGEVEEGVFLKPDALFSLDLSQEKGTERRAPLPHKEVFEAVRENQELLLDDGKIRLRVIKKEPTVIETQVLYGGPLLSRKGVNLPQTILPLCALTPKDEKDLRHALKYDIDWVALSFVQRGEDIDQVREIVGSQAGIIAKIEKPHALEEIDAIIEKSDGIMIARGDLGVELPLEKVPSLQKRITLASRQAGKPVVVATQMLESMIIHSTPTRAEVSDVAQAVFEGADAIMLSAETASGEHPVEAVAIMDKIAKEVEQDPLYEQLLPSIQSHHNHQVDALCRACHILTDMIHVSAIVCYTNSGQTGYRMARQRPPRVPILAVTPSKKTWRRLTLVWGITSVLTTDPQNLEDIVEKACAIALTSGKACKGETIAITAGIPIGTPGSANMLRLAQLI